MIRIKRILNLAKSLTSKILNEETLDTHEIEQEFSERDTSDIYNSLTNEQLKKQREHQIKSINETKAQDWLTIKPEDNRENLISLVFFFRVAAIMVICFGLSYLYFDFSASSDPSQDSIEIVNEAPDPNSIILELGDGKKEVISSDGTISILNNEGKVVGVQKGTNLNYTNAVANKLPEELVWNKLTIPYGKVFEIVLSDKTIVHLNAGSSIRYPVQFLKGQDRNVFLEGEAFFEVTKNTDQPFVVHTDNMNVEVLGTKFNVSSYPEDPTINTVLVEGSVSINSNLDTKEPQKTMLRPGHKLDWEKQKGSIALNKVDTTIYTAWIEGRIVFEHMPFNNILKKLERRYNVSITNNNPNLATETFTASFDIETIDQVLMSFSKNYNFTYNIDKNQITIN